MKAILSADRKWGLGYQGRLLVSIPSDLRFFRETTMGLSWYIISPQSDKDSIVFYCSIIFYDDSIQFFQRIFLNITRSIAELI